MKNQYRVLVCGGRNYQDADHMFHMLNTLLPRPTVIIQGEARGADIIAKIWAQRERIKVEGYPADWANLTHPGAILKRLPNGMQYDTTAGHRRNQKMIDEGKPDLVLAFPGGAGTADMKQRAFKAGIEVREV